MKISFKSFSSGSAGNCYLLSAEDGSRKASILLDAGVSLRTVKADTPLEDLKAILISHDHWDHIKSIGSFCKKLSLPVWSTQAIHKAMRNHPYTGTYLNACTKNFEEGWNQVVPGIFEVQYFVVPHDAAQTIGFAIRIFSSKLYVHITDCGAMTPPAIDWCKQADILTIESNYDTQMLLDGPYTRELKDRIRSGNGHLSNDECAKAVKQCLHPSLGHIFLCHLSENNNTPAKAVQTTREVIEGTDINLAALPRRAASPLFNL